MICSWFLLIFFCAAGPPLRAEEIVPVPALPAATTDYARVAAPKTPLELSQGSARAGPLKAFETRLKMYSLELGSGMDPLAHASEPFARKGIPQPFDWDVKTKFSVEGLGFLARHRRPEHVGSLALAFLKYVDVPRAVGLDHFNDEAHSLLGQTAEKPRGGFAVAVSGTMNQYLGGATSFDQKTTQKGDRWVDRATTVMSAGYSPLGDNPEKKWNYTLLGSVLHDKLFVKEPGFLVDDRGFGYFTGVAYQRAVHEMPFGVVKDPKDAKILWIDRIKTQVGVGQSQVTSLAVSASAEVTFYLFRRLQLTTGVTSAFMPRPNPKNPLEKKINIGAIFGVDWRF